MPYKVQGTNIMHYKKGKWVIKQRMTSKADAYGIMTKLKDIDDGESLFKGKKKMKK